jgi:DNA-damage-inducible protein J
VVGSTNANSDANRNIDEQLDREASAILAQIGMSVDDAFRLLLTQVVHDECLPFEMHVPNAETIEAMQAADRGEGQHFASAEELFKELGI